MDVKTAVHVQQSWRSTLAGLIQLMRPHQWIKNSFVISPLIFSGQFLNPTSILQILIAAFLFCTAASSIYIINDINDVEHDRRHPKKAKNRPLASNSIQVSQAILLLLILCSILLWGLLLAPFVMALILVYIIINLAYIFVLKYHPVVDIFAIAIGFVLRVYTGALALHVSVSSWMLVTTLCLALYLAAIKRRQELIINKDSSRNVLKKYTVALVDRYAEMSAMGALVFYSLFVMSVQPRMVITIPLVIYGIYRYWFLVDIQNSGESPTDTLVSDWQLIFTIISWAFICMWVLWPT